MSVATHTVVLVEGVSDQLAVEALAERQGRSLASEGVAVVAMGGATNIAKFLERFGPHGLDLRVAGLCDQGEIRIFERGLERGGFGSGDLSVHHFYVCVSDLEDELIRAIGVPAVEGVLSAEGDLASFRLFQRQPAQREKPDSARLRRFMGTRGGRKIHYAPVLVRALALDHLPLPLEQLLAAV